MATGKVVGAPWRAAASRHWRRLKVGAVLAVVAGLGWAVNLLWREVAPSIIHRQRYLLPAEAISATPPPAWIDADVAGDVITRADLDERLSILDPRFVPTIRDAFALSPWVESVDRIEKHFPPAVHVQLTYRQPVAVVEIAAGGNLQLLPVDRHGVHLPAQDVPEIRRRYLPRITGVVGQPPIGSRWDDPRVDGAVDIANRLADRWEQLHLVEIHPSARPEIRGPRRYFVYDLVTDGGTRIVWGAAPLDGPPGEADFADKLARLQRCVRELGPLDSVRGPAVVDVRRDLRITPRTAQLWPEAIGQAATRALAVLRDAAARVRLAVESTAARR